MSVLRIEGSYSLDGIIKIQGSKNGVLPVMAASLLHNGTTVLEHVPKIQDVFCMLGILNALGADCRMEENRLVISAVSLSGARIPEILAGQMRSSVMLLGPLLARLGQVETSLPGGCRIGRRPVDLHFLGLTALGASVEKQNGMIRAVCPSGGLSGARIHLPYPSVGATENILMAAAGARGETVLTGAAREPEIEILCGFLRAMGVRVEGEGTSVIKIRGTSTFEDTSFFIPGDRIVAGTCLIGVLAAGGEAFLRQAPIGQLTAVIAVAKKMGAQIIPTPKGLLVKRAGRLVSPLLLETDVYPGYPTDLQSPMLTALCCAEGNCMVSERVFNGRFGVHEQLNRMGAAIVAGQTSAEVTGGRKLHGERVFAKELRGGAALVLAGLCAEHKTVVENCHFIRRGYEDIVRDFRELGADIGTETEI